MTSFSIIPKFQLEGAVRLDAEYYQPEYLEVVNKVLRLPHNTLENIAESLLSFGAYSLTGFIQWKESGIPFITAENVKKGFVDLGNVRYIDQKVDEILKKSRVYENEVLLAMSGKVGDAAVAVGVPQRLNSNQDIVKIKLKKEFSPYFLAVFLNSKFGRLQVLRLPVGSVQQHIFLWQTKSILIPKFSQGFIDEIEALYKFGLTELKNAQIFYQNAENLILEELGLKNFQVENELSYIVDFSEIKNVSRMDAEYFQPKYEQILNKLSNYRTTTLATNFQVIRSKNFEYKEDGEIGVIKTKQLNHSEINLETESQTTEDIMTKDSLPIIKNDDVLFASMGVGSLGKTNIFYKSDALNRKYTIDSTLRIFRKQNKREILPEVLVVFLNSLFGQELIYKYVVGTSGIISIYEEDIRNLVIPVLPEGVQQKIADLVRQSHEARKKSKELLEEAKRKVEEMIEKDGDN